MKNLLIVFTVLAVASTASAGLTLSVNGDIDPPQTEVTLKPSDIVTIDIHNDTAAPGLAVFLHLDSALGAWDSLDNATNAVNPALPPFDMEIISPAFAGVIQVDLSKPDPEFRLPIGMLADGILFHCEAIGDVTILLTDSPIAGLGNVLDSQVIHQVPEPITFALLGLGGLFLRRRK